MSVHIYIYNVAYSWPNSSSDWAELYIRMSCFIICGKMAIKGHDLNKVGKEKEENV